MSSSILDQPQRADTPGTAETVWTRQGVRLWVGQRDGRCIGTIERGSRFVFMDVDAVARCAHRTLADAQSAHTGPEVRCPPLRGASGGHPRIRLTAAALAAAVMTVLFIVVVAAVL